MLIGYARVSTDDQNLDLQRAALNEVGCTRIYEEKLSGASHNRPELAQLLGHLRGGDVVVVSRLDRLARSTRDLLDIAALIKEAEAGLRSLSEPWADTTSPAGRMVLTVFAGTGEFERALIHQRTGAGRAAARARGVRFGRPPKLTAEQVDVARRLIDEARLVPGDRGARPVRCGRRRRPHLRSRRRFGEAPPHPLSLRLLWQSSVP